MNRGNFNRNKFFRGRGRWFYNKNRGRGRGENKNPNLTPRNDTVNDSQNVNMTPVSRQTKITSFAVTDLVYRGWRLYFPDESMLKQLTKSFSKQ